MTALVPRSEAQFPHLVETYFNRVFPAQDSWYQIRSGRSTCYIPFSLSQILKVFLTELLFSVPLNKMWMECLVSACRSQPVFLLTYAGHPRKGVLDLLWIERPKSSAVNLGKIKKRWFTFILHTVHCWEFHKMSVFFIKSIPLVCLSVTYKAGASRRLS